MKTRYKIYIVAILLVVAYIGGFIHGRQSVEKYPSKYIKQIRAELIDSTESNRIIQENNREIARLNQEIRAGNIRERELVDGIGITLEDFDRGIEETGDIIAECIELVRSLRKLYSEVEKEQ